jgi:hypothetical protein
MPDARDQNVIGLRQDDIEHDVAGCAEANHDLAYAGIPDRHAYSGKFLQPFDCCPDHLQSAPRGSGII